MTHRACRCGVYATIAVLAAALVPTCQLAAADPAELKRLFPLEARLDSDGPGLCRLPLTAEILSRCRSDLSDLRVFSASGKEIPYLVDSMRVAVEDVEVVLTRKAVVKAAERREERSDAAPARYHESYGLHVPELPADASAWELVVDPRLTEMVAKLDLVAVGEGDRRQTLINGGSAFRLSSPRSERLRFAIPPWARSLHLVFVSEGAGYLNPSFTFQAHRMLYGISPSTVPLTAKETHHKNGLTTVVLTRPQGLVPDQLRMATTTSSFRRSVTVWDDGPGSSPDALGTEALFRIAAIAPMEDVQVDLSVARGDRLRVVIEDLDSPPLEDLSFDAVVVSPVLFFSMPEGETTAVLRFGGARAHHPTYDLAALRPPGALPVSGETAEMAMPFWDASQARVATMGPIRSNADYDPQPALAFAMRPGAALDGRPYEVRRRLEVKPSAEGLSRLTITPEDLSAARRDLADLRVVDEQSRQWAYLVQRRATRSDLILSVAEQSTSDRQTTYGLTLPYTPLHADRMFLEFSEPFFDRDFDLMGKPEDDNERPLATGRLTRHRGDPRPVTLAFKATRLEAMDLTVADGDDAPLSLSRVTVRVPQPDLYLAAPAGTYFLLLGNPDAESPRYELERVRSTVLAVPANAISSSPLEKNPAFASTSRFASSAGAQQLALWIVLGIAVLALGGLTLRLAGKDRSE